MKLVSKAMTAESGRDEIVMLIRQQATGYSTRARMAERKGKRAILEGQRDALNAIADLISGIEYE